MLELRVEGRTEERVSQSANSALAQHSKSNLSESYRQNWSWEVYENAWSSEVAEEDLSSGGGVRF